jgi:hypothetical protein
MVNFLYKFSYTGLFLMLGGIAHAQQNPTNTDLGFNLSIEEITISENNQPTTETSREVLVDLLSAPQSNAKVTLSYADTSEFTVTPQSIEFTPSNWNIPQAFTFNAINDNLKDGNQTVSVSFTISSTAHDSGSGDGSHDSGSGDGSHDSGSGDGSHDSGSGDGSHDSGSGDGSHDSGSGDGSHDSGSGDGSHDSGSGDGSHDSGSGDGSHDSGSGDGSHDSGSGDGSTDFTHTKTLTVNVLDFNLSPADIDDVIVKVGFDAVGFKLVSGVVDPDNDTLILIATTPLSNGTVSLVNDEILYTPDDKFTGHDSFSFKISDGIFETSETSVSITVVGLGDINGDGVIGATDVVYLASHLVGIDGYVIPDSFNNVFDVDQDGQIGATDIVYLASHLVGIDGYDLIIN